MELLGLIAKFFEYLTSWLPRPFLVNHIERGVRFTLGRKPVLVSPGFHVLIPLFQSARVYTIVQQATEFTPCVLMTKDEKPVLIGFTMMFRIADPVKAATETDDIVQTVGEIGESLLPRIVVSHTMTELREAIEAPVGYKGWSFDRTLSSEAQKMLRPYGLEVDYARVNNIAPCRVFKLVQG